ncbi:MAG: hypothetical protein ACXVHJ_34345, partial [Solirubrobacteraceae bacterium]
RYRDSSNSQVSGPSSEEPGTAPFVKEQQSRTALLLVVRSRRRDVVINPLASVVTAGAVP